MLTQPEIVRERVPERLKAADGNQRVAPKCNGGAEGEAGGTEGVRKAHGWCEPVVDEQAAEPGGAVVWRYGVVQAGNDADAGIAQWCRDSHQVIRWRADVAVRQYQPVMTRMRQ